MGVGWGTTVRAGLQRTNAQAQVTLMETMVTAAHLVSTGGAKVIRRSYWHPHFVAQSITHVASIATFSIIIVSGCYSTGGPLSR
jgi:hypothetical protein